METRAISHRAPPQTRFFAQQGRSGAPGQLRAPIRLLADADDALVYFLLRTDTELFGKFDCANLL